MPTRRDDEHHGVGFGDQADEPDFPVFAGDDVLPVEERLEAAIFEIYDQFVGEICRVLCCGEPSRARRNISPSARRSVLPLGEQFGQRSPSLETLERCRQHTSPTGIGASWASRPTNMAPDRERSDLDRADRHIAEAKKQWPDAEGFKDFRKLLEKKDVDVVVCGTVDHWHALVSIAAMRAGKDVYCEKPLTLTIDEGRHIIRALRLGTNLGQIM